jgi:hypothetical protein
VTISELPHFGALHRVKKAYAECPPEVLAKYRGIVPKILANTWEQFGFQEFSNGFLWSVNPDAFRAVVSGFVYPDQLEESHVLFRTGFGDLIISYKGKLFHFSAVTLIHAELSGTLEQVLEMDLGQREFANSIFFLTQFNGARKKLGSPTESEVYGASLGVPLRGVFNIDMLRKLNLREHLRLLSLIAKPKAP